MDGNTKSVEKVSIYRRGVLNIYICNLNKEKFIYLGKIPINKPGLIGASVTDIHCHSIKSNIFSQNDV